MEGHPVAASVNPAAAGLDAEDRRQARRRAGAGGVGEGQLAPLEHFTAAQWVAGVYLGIGGGALAFILWVMALARATPTRVANTMTVNPIAAALLAALLIGEPITANLLAGLVAVFAGIGIATSEGKAA
ncbi:EamA family transporter [Bradyrhizobium yuanmingense]|uniref:EamA family transporter n=1 Tax=Bradyrhizobium yuanmingense TaxID=108015 RepID=UPI0035166723